MKIIFLDIDGVLNKDGCDVLYKGYYFVLDDKIMLLKEIIDVTGAKVVLSSTWREGWLEMDKGVESSICIDLFKALREKLFEFGIEFLDYTPIGLTRGEEIDYWLKNWKGEKIESFVILDDLEDEFLRFHSNRLVKTSSRKGLEEYHVGLAIKLLGGRGYDNI